MSDLGNKKIFSKNLKYYMELNNKDRNDVCRDLSLPYTTFTSWYNGEFYPRIDKIELLANYFDIKKSDLVENHEYINEPNKYVLDLYNSLTQPNQLEAVRYMRYLKTNNVSTEPKIQILGQTAAWKPIEYGDSYAQDIEDVSDIPVDADYALTVNRR